MRLVENWKAKLMHAWSLRLVAFAGIAELGKEALPFISEWVPKWLPILILAAAAAASLVKQDKVSGGAP
jgi:hypothetical protein